MVKCPNCDMELPDDSSFCPYCRSAVRAKELPVEERKRCPVCHAPVDADARFCRNCRSPLAVLTPEPPASSAPACPKCGARIPGGGTFCTACGERLKFEPSSPPAQHTGTPTEVRSVGPPTPQSGSPEPTPAQAPPPTEHTFSSTGTVSPPLPEVPPPVENAATISPTSVPAMPQERQVPPELPAPSTSTPKKSLVKTWWVWAAAAVIVAGCAAFWVFFSAPSSAPANASVLVDDFARDRSLPTGLWTINGPVGSAVASSLTSAAGTLIKPQLTFSSQNGLDLGGVTEKGQVATVETIASFEAPFRVEADVMPSGRDGRPFGLIVSDRSGLKGVGIVGRLGSAAGPGGIDYTAPEAGTGWKSQGALCSSLQANMWYTLSLSLDSQGTATVAVRKGVQLIGHATLPTGKGPFNILLWQEGVGGSTTDHGQVYWRSIKEASGSMMRLMQLEKPSTPAIATVVSKERPQRRLRHTHPPPTVPPPPPVVSVPPRVVPAPPASAANSGLSGTWLAYVKGFRGPLRVSVQQSDGRLVGYVIGGDPSITAYLPVGKELFYGKYSFGAFSAQEICAALNYTNPSWHSVTFKVIDNDHLQEDLTEGGCSGFPIIWERVKDRTHVSGQ